MYAEPDFVLPHPRISLAVFLVLEEALSAAWEILRLHPPPGFDLVNAIERQLNHQLQEVLKDRIWNRDVVPGFDGELIRTVTRPAVRNYNGEHIDKLPDMMVELVDIPEGVRPSQYGIFIECKPVDAKHSLVGHYCDEGVLRFVRGDYAWAMTQAMMIGYVDSAGLPAERLAVALRTRRDSVFPTGDPTTCARSQAPVPVAISEHRRNFRYVENGLEAAPIVLRHLWLRRN
jgi:hypothetical protein